MARDREDRPYRGRLNQEAMLRWRPIGQYPYSDYRDQQADYTSDVRGIIPSSPFLLNRQGKAGQDIYTVAPATWTPYPISRENWLPNPPAINPQIFRMGGIPDSGLSIYATQKVGAGGRAWPYLKNRMRDILFRE
jgi:hypothetical protein